MARQNPQRLSPADIDEIWSRLRRRLAGSVTCFVTFPGPERWTGCRGVVRDGGHRVPARAGVEVVRLNLDRDGGDLDRTPKRGCHGSSEPCAASPRARRDVGPSQ